jgi:hypothetical protein
LRVEAAALALAVSLIVASFSAASAWAMAADTLAAPADSVAPVAAPKPVRPSVAPT